MKLDELLAELVGVKVDVAVVLRGKTISVQPLTDFEVGMIRGIFPEPRPPQMKNPEVGSAHPRAMIENPDDPEYKVALHEWFRSITAAKCAALLDRTFLIAGTEERRTEVLKLRQALTQQEIDRVVSATENTNLAALEEQAKKA